MDDGHLTDGQGNVINFKNTIIICTSNAGFGDGNEEFDDIMDEMKKFFRPEFLNRFNGIVKFEHLGKDALQDIVNLWECKIVCVNRYCMNLLYAPYWGKQR